MPPSFQIVQRYTISFYFTKQIRITLIFIPHGLDGFLHLGHHTGQSFQCRLWTWLRQFRTHESLRFPYFQNICGRNPIRFIGLIIGYQFQSLIFFKLLSDAFIDNTIIRGHDHIGLPGLDIMPIFYILCNDQGT